MRKGLVRTGRAGIPAFLALLVFSCGSPEPGNFEDPSGAVLVWTPRNPLIGDLVELTATIPGDTWSSDRESPTLQDGEGKDMEPLYRSFHGKDIELRWNFRATRQGVWTWGKDHRVLWSVPAAAKDGQDLVLFNSQDLWLLKADPALQPAPAGSSSAGSGSAGPAPAPGAGKGSI